MNEFNWTIFFIILAIGVFGTLAVIPYSLALNPAGMEALKAKQVEGKKSLPPSMVILLATSVQGLVLSAVAAFLGLLAANRMGLQLPVITAIAAGQQVDASLTSFVPLAIIAGVVSGVVLMALERFVFYSHLPVALRDGDKRSAFWKRALACFYGGFVEEILLRLFIMSGFSWLISLVWKAASTGETTAIFWIANILAALLFGAGHLPATAQITKLTPLVLFRAFLLNGLCGIVFGWLYMRYGLESAMLAHFSADIIIHLVWPAIYQTKPVTVPVAA
jgi:membrane protease YdiL (CAAX protease family)